MALTKNDFALCFKSGISLFAILLFSAGFVYLIMSQATSAQTVAENAPNRVNAPSFIMGKYFGEGNSYGDFKTGDFNRDGKLDIAAVNSGNRISILLGNGDGSFNAPLSFMTETNPGQIAAADFNNDNKLDIAVVIRGASVVAIHLGNGNGTFGLSDIYTTANNPQALVIKDFTGDGVVDIATVNSSSSVSMLRSLGNGSFVLALNSTVASGYDRIAAGDFDSDGDNDIIISSQYQFNVGDYSYINNGTGSFSDQITHSIPGGTAVLTTGDLDGNGLTDIVSSPRYGEFSILLRNSGQRAFTKLTFPLINRDSSYGLVLGDFNSDGKTDAALTNSRTNNLSVYLNNSTPSLFGVSTEYSIGAIGPNQVAGLNSGDFNNDGKIDLLSWKKGRFFLLLNRGDGTFQAPFSASTDFLYSNTSYIALGNFDGDSQIDMLTGGGRGINSLRGDGSGKFFYRNSFGRPSGDAVFSTQTIPADFDADGKQDVLDITSYVCSPGGCFGTFDITIYTGNGDGSFNVTNRLFTVGRQPSSAAVGDFNGDGRLDAVVASYIGISGSNGSLSYLRGNGQGSFNTAVNYVIGGGAYWNDKGDFNRDGKLDVVVTRTASNNVAVLLNNGDGTFGAPTTFAVGTNPSFVTVRDLNNDGKLDLIVVNRDSNNISILFGNGNGTFGAATNFGGLSSPISLAIADFNGDNKPDLAVANTTGGFVSVLSGLGGGTFSAPTNFQTDVLMVAIAAYDFNGDDKVDIATASANENKSDAIILINNGDQGTVANQTTPFDFDGDGKSDLSVYRPSNGIWYLLNSQSGFTANQFGISTDKIVSADYDGDGKTDVAVYRDGIWYLLRSSQGFTSIQFGLSSDIPQPSDFDGDGKSEIAVYRPSNGFWYVFNLANSQFTAFQFGISEDKPVVGDYDGDNRADYAVFRPSNGIWYYQRSTAGFGAIQFGIATDKPVPADYDGDGKTDVAVYRPSNGVWYLQKSTDGFSSIQFGLNTDKPVPADYDGDRKADVAVFRPSDGVWYLQRSMLGFTGIQFGIAEDKPIPNAFVP